MKKIRLAVLGIALVGTLSTGFNSSFTNQALNVGETGGAPTRPDFAPAYSIGDGGGAPSNNHGDVPAPKAF